MRLEPWMFQFESGCCVMCVVVRTKVCQVKKALAFSLSGPADNLRTLENFPSLGRKINVRMVCNQIAPKVIMGY